MNIESLLKQLCEEVIVKGTMSQPKVKSEIYQKIAIRWVQEKHQFYQLECFTLEQVFHKNVDEKDCYHELIKVLTQYKQFNCITKSHDYIIRISNKGKIHITKKAVQIPVTASTHNKMKLHILPEGRPVDFLIHLGLMDQQGNVKHKWYDKFRQINRYLELIEDSLSHIDTIKPTIIDFGCGKSYLTFALYYYLVEIKKMEVTIIGLDLKESVIQNLNQLTKELDYKGLEFRVGDIAMFDYEEPIDMVISLHACNLATDYAIEKAIKWKAKVIMAVPCCHKEANQQIKPSSLEAIFSFGILKERMAALITDGLRADLIATMGYETQVLEFVETEHTPKNLMIRAYKKSEDSDKKVVLKPSQQYIDCCQQFGLKLTLESLLFPVKNDASSKHPYHQTH